MSTTPGAVVAITGVAGQLGGTLARLLESDDRVARVVGLDIRPADQSLTKTRFVRHDITQPGLDELFRAEGVCRVAHFAFVLDTIHDRALAHRIDVGGSQNVLRAAAAAGAARVVFASSSVVFGASPDNPIPIPEDHPRRPHPRIQYTLDKVEVEDVCTAFQKEYPEIGVVVLRPVTIVGPRMNNFISRFMQKPILLVPRGFDPPWQFVHEVDCARAAQTMLFNDLRGPFNLGADDPRRLSEVLARCGRPIWRVPRRLLRASADLFWYLRVKALSEINGPLVDFLCWPPVLDNGRLKREAGFTFRYTSGEAIDDYFRSRGRA
ncbi:MAG TPA: NAD-dependent epimerase/dehydratase family protein [Gemmataceae bacterium]|nr:NAD-dependent epimerase/dehydratase family protein [Gemmataceae bacterium]